MDTEQDFKAISTNAPTTCKETPDGDIERTLCIGLRPTDSGINSKSKLSYYVNCGSKYD